MQKSLLFLFSVMLSLTLKAQLNNASFEQTDSLGKIAHWNLLSGNTTQLTGEQFGVIPFMPFEGNYFVLLESDTQTAVIQKGVLQQTFPFADTPGSFEFHYFYIPEVLSNQGAIELLMSKWNGTSRDTVLYFTQPIVAVTDSNQIRIQWNKQAITLANTYRSAQLPDTATLRFMNDNGSPASKNIRLYLDALSFGKWAVGLEEKQAPRFTLYPNPANNQIWIEGATVESQFTLTGTDGKHYTVTASDMPSGKTIDTGALPNGLYLLHFQTQNFNETLRILINHEN